MHKDEKTVNKVQQSLSEDCKYILDASDIRSTTMFYKRSGLRGNIKKVGCDSKLPLIKTTYSNYCYCEDFQ